MPPFIKLKDISVVLGEWGGVVASHNLEFMIINDPFPETLETDFMMLMKVTQHSCWTQ